MRQISQAALTALLGAQPPYVKKITLERRAWNGSAYAFETPVDITSDLVEVGKTNFKLDEEGYNVWSYSNCTITVRNERNQWKEGNPDGYFPDGTVAAMSRITIEAGVFLEDGSVELAPVFCGYISEGAELLPDGRNAQLTVLGPMARLDAISAEDAAQFITGELAGSDSGTQFTTAQSGVGSIDKVLRGLTSSGVSGAVELVSSIDYTVAQLNEYSLGAKITLEQALSSGQSLWVSYRYWYRDQTVDALVGIVLDLAGVASRSVAVPEFAYGIRNTFSQTDQTGFATGQYSNTMWNPDVSGVSLLWNDYILRWWTPGTYVSPVIDGTANFMNWGAFNAGQQVPTGTTSSFTVRESADGATWSECADLAPGAQIPATLRYIQLRWNAACALNPPTATPALVSWTVEYFTSNVTIHQCDMSGYSCQDALEALATLCAFECGFDAAETFIFRPRSSSASSVISLDGCSVISADNLSSGADRVYNHVVVKFGDSTRVADSITEGEAAPTSIERFGLLVYEISGGNFLPADNVDLAYAVAPTVWKYTSKARRRITVTCRFLHHLELGDIVSLSIPDNQVLRIWRWGDGDAAYDDAGLRFFNDDFAAARLCAWNKLFRVEGIELNMENWQTKIDLTEVLKK